MLKLFALFVSCLAFAIDSSEALKCYQCTSCSLNGTANQGKSVQCENGVTHCFVSFNLEF